MLSDTDKTKIQSMTATATIYGDEYAVTIEKIDEARGEARVRAQDGEPFPGFTHGGWAYSADGKIFTSRLRLMDAAGNFYALTWDYQNGCALELVDDIRTPAQKDLDTWQAETEQTRQSDYPM